MPADSAGIGALHVASWRETYQGLVPDSLLAALSVSQRTALWVRILNEPYGLASTRVHVACIGARIVGFASCGPQRSAALDAEGYGGEISAIYVQRAFHGIHLGRDLFERAAYELRELHHRSFSLWVLRDNVQARGFYEHLGGKQIAERQDARPEATLHEIAYGWQS